MASNPVYRNILLPNKLVDYLNGCQRKGKKLIDPTNAVQPIDRCKLLKALYIIQSNRKEKEDGFYSYKKLSKQYLEKSLGKEPYKVIDWLGHNHIIDCDEDTGKGVSLGYRISSKWLQGDWTKVPFHYKVRGEKPQDVAELETFTNNFRTLTIPFPKLYRRIEKEVEFITVQHYKIDNEVKFPYKEVTVRELWDDGQYDKIGVLTKKQALDEARSNGKTLIDTGYGIIIADLDFFVARQKDYVGKSWKQAVDNLTVKTLYAKRNETNNRLDTNFTNLAKPLYDIILLTNGYGESDLMNSQPTLLGHILKTKEVEGEGVSNFIELTESGKFYDDFGDDRAATKKLMFKVLFGKSPEKAPKNNTILAEFMEQFPAVYDYIREQKQEKGKEAVAVELQKLESKLFIDGIYYDLIGQDVICFTKHDSISYHHKYHDVVEKTIRKHFDRMRFNGRIKTEYVINTAA
ncbi:hypothetical protein [Flagellimonas onchidii]|uniref:hypothetical protein n=1 Tax=Flagellimonas onchidii TaxID=2562684 RepID=UPI0010A62BDC|nr:hypothetical protein [Allomuricauda onchidii]